MKLPVCFLFWGAPAIWDGSFLPSYHWQILSVCAFSEMLEPAVWRLLCRDGSFSSVGFLLQASEFYSGQPLSIVSPPKVAAVSCSCYFMFRFCLFSHPLNNSLGYIFSLKYLVYNSCILTGSHWRQWIETKSLIMVPMPPKSVSQTLPELLNIFPSHLIFLLELKFLWTTRMGTIILYFIGG